MGKITKHHGIKTYVEDIKDYPAVKAAWEARCGMDPANIRMPVMKPHKASPDHMGYNAAVGDVLSTQWYYALSREVIGL